MINLITSVRILIRCSIVTQNPTALPDLLQILPFQRHSSLSRHQRRYENEIEALMAAVGSIERSRIGEEGGERGEGGADGTTEVGGEENEVDC